MLKTLVVGVALIALVGCGPEKGEAPGAPAGAAPEFANLGPEVSFTGDAACAECHEDVWQAYQGHAMARSFYPMSAEESVEDYAAQPVYDERSGFWYRAYREGDRFYQEEFRQTTAGQKTHSLTLPMQYVMGSGNAARTYYADQDGWLRQLPLTWFSQVGRWAMSPGYEKANKRFDRLVPERCMACHNGYPESVPHTDGKYLEVPHGIGCERCHGPGGVHVEARRRDPEPAGERDLTIVNPAHLDAERQLDVCQQCHLNTTVSILREGRTAFDFRPSQRLDDYLSLFVSSAGDDEEIGVISHADRMRSSRCFTETVAQGGAMTCTTCHDPHSTFRDRGPEYFDTTCRSCHSVESLATAIENPDLRTAHVEGSGCATCHMPYQAAGEAPHASFTDHRIRVVTQGSESDRLPSTDDLEPYFEKDRSGPGADRYAGIASIVLARQRGDSQRYRDGITRLESYASLHPDDGEARYLAGFALVALGEMDRAIPHLEAAAQAGEIPERLNTLAEAYAAIGREPMLVEATYRRALAVQPALATIRVNLGRFLQAQGRLGEAEAEYAAAASEMPWLAEAHFNLGTAKLAQGDLEPARRSLDEAIRLDPDYGKALGNRAILALQEGDRRAAGAFLARAAAASPRDPVILANWGAFLVESDDLDRAITALRQAIQIAPDQFDALVNLSVALVRIDRPAEARPYAERAARLRPNDPTVRSILEAL